MQRTIGFLAALSAFATPLLVAAPAQAAVYSAPLRTVVRHLPVAVENNIGYDRATWRYGSDTDGDCYNTQAEVLQQETRAPIVYTGCTAKTGRWLSYADNKIHTLASAPVVFDAYSKSYKEQAAVGDLTFTVSSGCIAGLLGPNGAGKSTVLRGLVGLVRPTSGSALILVKHWRPPCSSPAEVIHPW